MVFAESRQGSSLGSGARDPESLQDGYAESPEQAKCVPREECLDARYSALSHLFSCSFKIIKLIVMLIKCQTVQELPCRGPVVRLRLPMQGVQVRSLVQELRSYVPPGQKTET